eukprot:750446-Hanusia_phi.AAC.5
MRHLTPYKTQLSSQTSAPSTESSVAVPSCSPTVDMYRVGSCKPFASLQQDCASSPGDAFARMLAEAAEALKGEKPREVKRANGVTVNNVHLPGSVWVLLGEELFVFPTCEVGSTFDVPLPSVNKVAKAKVRSVSPRVVEVEDFLTPEECEKLISTAKPLMSRSTVSAEGDSAISLQESLHNSLLLPDRCGAWWRDLLPHDRQTKIPPSLPTFLLASLPPTPFPAAPLLLSASLS